MNSQTITNWIQIITGIAMVIGLGLVVYEIRQSSQFAYGHILATEMANLNNMFVATMGEDPRSALATASLRPSELSEEDAVTLHSYYSTVLFNWISINRSAEVTGIERPLAYTIGVQVRQYFGSQPGRRWLKSKLDSGSWPENVMRPVRAALSELPDDEDYFKHNLQTILRDVE